ncbi:putative endonuclease [Rhodobium orientis]|uniref:UPF0102 protein CH339_11320 n=1 Tax=Rhodobium orientis TaxID=34017 RepID=A0A327JVF6_9HYPH|nr:YraN family protein [Rhodobium orientis]MBB4301980.1 putative endonuclease [Rhodobium orientis]MBK5950217.1 YraN family protein [Rhodobium orientis]RAI27178.1 YraN family protein [Rhodobium orientis]
MTSEAKDTGKRRAAFRRGLSAEAIAAMFLRVKGYRILARRFRSGRGEIDLVARRGDTVAFVEVKARSTAEAAIEAVDARTRARIAAAANAWIARQPDDPAATYRFDVVLIVPGRLPVHLVNAFEGA